MWSFVKTFEGVNRLAKAAQTHSAPICRQGLTTATLAGFQFFNTLFMTWRTTGRSPTRGPNLRLASFPKTAPAEGWRLKPLMAAEARIAHALHAHPDGTPYAEIDPVVPAIHANLAEPLSYP